MGGTPSPRLFLQSGKMSIGHIDPQQSGLLLAKEYRENGGEESISRHPVKITLLNRPSVSRHKQIFGFPDASGPPRYRCFSDCHICTPPFFKLLDPPADGESINFNFIALDTANLAYFSSWHISIIIKNPLHNHVTIYH